MDWISVEDKLPENKTRVIMAVLSRPENVPAHYDIRPATYKMGDFMNHWMDDHSHSLEAPTHWKPFPTEAPPIEYENDPKDCNHSWCENLTDRYCKRCGTVQKEIKLEKRWEGES